jgi:hypothetical protein
MRFLLILAMALCTAGCASRPTSMARQSDALTQYFMARDDYYRPAFKVRGQVRQERLRQAVSAFQAVVRYFPDEPSLTTRALAEYYTGLCQLHLGETLRARHSFVRCRDFSRHEATLPAAGAAALKTITTAAADRLQALDE